MKFVYKNSRIKFFIKYFLPLIILVAGFTFYMDYINTPVENYSEIGNENLDEIINEDDSTQDENEAQELKIEDIILGEGDEVKEGDNISVNYTGTLIDGTKFDSSYDKNEPFTFTIGEGKVIQGWEQGILGMKAGGKRKLTIPPNLAYGEQGTVSIPANSILIFEVELISINN